MFLSLKVGQGVHTCFGGLRTHSRGMVHRHLAVGMNVGLAFLCSAECYPCFFHSGLDRAVAFPGFGEGGAGTSITIIYVRKARAKNLSHAH